MPKTLLHFSRKFLTFSHIIHQKEINWKCFHPFCSNSCGHSSSQIHLFSFGFWGGRGWGTSLISFSFSFFSCSRELEHAGEEESVILEGDIGGGLVLQRHIYFPKNDAKVFRIDSGIIARSVGAGSGGFSRFYLTAPLLT